MGTDWLQLFNKRLCDEILSLDPTALTDFVSTHLRELKPHNELRLGFTDQQTAEERIQKLQCEGLSELELKEMLVRSLCVIGPEIYLDYWGCYAEIFSTDPIDSINERTLFSTNSERVTSPQEESSNFLLLRPEHLDKMLASLEEHRSEISVMTDREISLLRDWRDQCSSDPNMMAVYFFDY